jgi:hypothetical protein
MLAICCSGVSLLGFIALFIGDGDSSVWIATATFAITNGFEDVGLVMIPLVVGASRAGVGYVLVIGLSGNVANAVFSFTGGDWLESGKDDDFLFFSASFTIAGSVCIYRYAGYNFQN